MNEELRKVACGAEGPAFERSPGVHLARAWLFGLAAFGMLAAAAAMTIRAVIGPWPLDVAWTLIFVAWGFLAASFAMLIQPARIRYPLRLHKDLRGRQ